jgi:hypothetical protein
MLRDVPCHLPTSVSGMRNVACIRCGIENSTVVPGTIVQVREQNEYDPSTGDYL